jgi:hypothetical protein
MWDASGAHFDALGIAPPARTLPQDPAPKENAKPVPINSVFKLAGVTMMLLLAWVVLGVGAFIMSLVCISKKGSSGGQNVIGLLLALLLGPFYWLYFLGSSTYCKAMPMPPRVAK